jgi:hypothetical protein
MFRHLKEVTDIYEFRNLQNGPHYLPPYDLPRYKNYNAYGAAASEDPYSDYFGWTDQLNRICKSTNIVIYLSSTNPAYGSNLWH